MHVFMLAIICFKKFYSSDYFRNHYQRHKTNTTLTWPSFVFKGLSYQCQKCLKLLLCDIDIVERHMLRAHQTKLKVRITNKITKEAMYRDFCKSFINKTPVSHSYWQGTTLPISKVPIEEITPNIGNLCTYNCPKCNEKFSSWYKLTQHSKKVHDHKIGYKPSLLCVARSHACLICPKAILCDRFSIAQHIVKAHNINMNKYEKLYIKNGGETLPTFRDWMTIY